MENHLDIEIKDEEEAQKFLEALKKSKKAKQRKEIQVTRIKKEEIKSFLKGVK